MEEGKGPVVEDAWPGKDTGKDTPWPGAGKGTPGGKDIYVHKSFSHWVQEALQLFEDCAAATDSDPLLPNAAMQVLNEYTGRMAPVWTGEARRHRVSEFVEVHKLSNEAVELLQAQSPAIQYEVMTDFAQELNTDPYMKENPGGFSEIVKEMIEKCSENSRAKSKKS